MIHHSIFRKTDGYLEVAAIPSRGMVELFFSAPRDPASCVVRAHLSEGLALRLALWMLWYCIWNRLLGLRSWQETRKQRAQLLMDAQSEDMERII